MKALEAVLVDLIHQRAVTGGNDMSVYQDMGVIHMKRLQNSGAVGDDQKCAVPAPSGTLPRPLDTSAYRIHIQSGICLIQDGQDLV